MVLTEGEHMAAAAFHYRAHPRLTERTTEGPPTVRKTARRLAVSPVTRFNSQAALGITRSVGTMWCAYAFAALALVSLPAALMSGSPIIIVAWIAQTFLQL